MKIVNIWYGRVVASWGSFYDCLSLALTDLMMVI